MAQFDIYINPNDRTRDRYPFLLDVQNDLFEQFDTRLEIPLASKQDIPKPLDRLNPVFKIAGRECVLSTPEMAGVANKHLGDNVGTLALHRTEILDAMDFLISGFYVGRAPLVRCVSVPEGAMV